MTMTELREAFAAWPPPKGDIDAAFRLLRLLKDPTPITEAGLRELGFANYTGSRHFWMIDSLCLEFTDGEIWYAGRPYKTLGQLRGLLLSVGE